MRVFVLLAVLLLPTGCRRPDDQKTESIGAEDVRKARADLSPALVAQLDSGSAAYRARDYERARAHYQAATRMDEKSAAVWFGIYMTEILLGNAEPAEEALRRAQKLAPGASLLRPAPDTTPR